VKIKASLSRILGIFIGFIALRHLFQRSRKKNLSARHAAAPIKALCLLLGGLLLLGCAGDPILGLTALYLSPQSAFVTINNYFHFDAYGILNNDASNPELETLNVTWNNATGNIAQLDVNADGGYLGVSPGGPVSVSATGKIGVIENNGGTGNSGSNITAFGLLTVTNSPLVSIAINPSNPSIPLGSSDQFTATGTFADGTTADITNSVIWTATDATVATISTAATPSGSITGIAVGGGLAVTAPGASAGQVTQITAGTTVGDKTVSASTVLTISDSVLTSISVTPATSTLTVGSTQQYAALGTFTSASGATTAMLAASALIWSSSDTHIATIISGGDCTATPNTGNSCGLASAADGIGGPINITASVTVNGQNISGNAQLSATTGATLLSIDVEPIAQSVAPGTTQQYTAQGIFSDGSTLDVTDAVNWTSSNTAAASINAQGLAAVPTGATAGSDTIIGASTQVSGQTVSAIAILTVAGNTLVSISVTPATASVAINGTQQFTVTGTYSDSTTQNLTGSAAWTSSDPSVATIVSGNGCAATPNTSNSCGFATGVAAGSPVTITASVTASGQSFTGTAQLTVNTLVSVSVTPATASVAVNGTQQFTVTGTYSDNTTQNLTGSAAWTSSDTSIATIVSGNGCTATPNTSNSCGFATGVAAGSPVTITASVTASGQTFNGTASLTVSGSSQLACNPPPNPSGGGSLPYENESYCASFSGLTDQGYTFTGTLTFTTPITPGAIINCEYATSGTWNSLPASTGPTPCTGGIDPNGNLNVTDALGNTFTGTFSSDGTSVSGTYSFTDFGPGGGVAAGSFSGTEQ